jgi:hypothetical protein
VVSVGLSMISKASKQEMLLKLITVALKRCTILPRHRRQNFGMWVKPRVCAMSAAKITAL